MVVNAETENAYSCNGSVPSVQFGVAHSLQYSDPEELSFLTYSFVWSPTTYMNNPLVNPANIYLPVPPVPSPNGPPLGPITYNFTLQVTNNNYGCTASNTQTVVVNRPRKVFLASAFSPNGDGLNDLYRPINLEDSPGSEFWIWNRWGNLMFHSAGPTSAAYSWDGKYNGVLQEMASYVWQVKIIGCPYNLYGATNGEGVTYGNVVLIR
jgi:gliding motility-associated-like protein